MYSQKQSQLAVAGMLITAVGLAMLFIVPIAVGVRLKYDFERIDRLENTRLAITDAIEAARLSDTFLMHRYTEPGDTRKTYDAETEYKNLRSNWRRATMKTDAIAPLDAQGQAKWSTGTALVSGWIEQYLSGYVGGGDRGGASTLESREKLFRRGLTAISDARNEAALQQDSLRKKQQWLNKAEVTIVAPMAIVCIALAFLAWMNLRTLQQTWMREREASGRLEVAVKESNHRIKNNLQVIGALIDMQMQDPGDTVPKSSLEDIVHQVRAVAAVHDFLSHEMRADEIQVDQMLRRLVDLSASPIGLRVDLETEAIALAVKQATAVALITNELLLNSGKHGATRARIVMTATESVACLRVTDNGPGFPSNFDAAQNANLGLSLVDMLARHDLQGDILYDNDSGARVEVTFPLAALV